MAAATVVQNNAPSPHSSSSAGSSPQSHTSRLTAPSNAPIYTQEDVVRFIQAALAAACRDHASHHQGQTRMQQDTRLVQEERIMKPRVHMYETVGERRKMITTLELPGLQKSDVSITARPNGDLIISGERRPQHLLYLHTLHEADGKDQSERDREDDGTEEPGRTVFNELKFGRFQRVIRLPNGTDPTTITASMDDGMLTICWPLPPASPTPEQHVKHETDSDDVFMDDIGAKRNSAINSS